MTVRITFLEPTGNSLTVEAQEGVSLMEAALANGVSGIPADCGGACSCATCHVYFSTDWFDRLAPKSDDEDTMIECVEEPFPTSRLSCQIRLSPELDGIEVMVPA